jgi:arylsulfatase A
VGIPSATTEGNREDFLSHSTGVIVPGFTPERVLPTLKAKAVSWLAEHFQNSPDKPFFLYLALNAPHLPVVPSAEFRGRSKAGLYGDYVMETDDAVGSIMETLRMFGALENTIVILTSDNGGLWNAWDPVDPDDVEAYKPTPRGLYNRKYGHQSNAELRGTKADIWEGGHRIPLVVQWPTVLKPGVTETPVELTDLFATIADAMSVPLPADAAPDSFSFFQVLLHPRHGKSNRPFLVHHSGNGYFSVTEGIWKYEEIRGSGGFSTPHLVKPKPGEATGQLYNMRADIEETKNLFSSQPDRVAHFQKLLEEIKHSHSLRVDMVKAAPKPDAASMGK